MKIGGHRNMGIFRGVNPKLLLQINLSRVEPNARLLIKKILMALLWVRRIMSDHTCSALVSGPSRDQVGDGEAQAKAVAKCAKRQATSAARRASKK